MTLRRHRTSTGRIAMLAALALLARASRARAQDPAAPGDSLQPFTCHGEIVSAVDVGTHPPPAKGSERVWRVVANAVGLPYGTTQAGVVAGLLQLRVGDPCTELHRAESERVLRAQPFLASAHVRALPDGAGRVRIVVETVDEVPAVVGGRLRGASLQALTLGNENVRGRALSIAISGERGHAYRDGIGLRVVDYAIFDGPYTAVLEVARRPLGSVWNAAIAHPFYTDLQPTAWRVAVRSADDYRRLVRPAGDPLALRVRQLRWEMGGMHRRRLLTDAGFVGAALIGVQDTPAQEGVIVSDTGLVADTGQALRGRYAPFRVVRPAALVGARLLHFVPVQGFNTLRAVEDLPSGVQLAGIAGYGVPAWGASDLYLAGTLYAGRVSAASLVGLQVEVEGRRDFDLGDWNGLVASGRLAWYRRHGARQLLVVSDEFSGGTRAAPAPAHAGRAGGWAARPPRLAARRRVAQRAARRGSLGASRTRAERRCRRGGVRRGRDAVGGERAVWSGRPVSRQRRPEPARRLPVGVEAPRATRRRRADGPRRQPSLGSARDGEQPGRRLLARARRRDSRAHGTGSLQPVHLARAVASPRRRGVVQRVSGNQSGITWRSTCPDGTPQGRSRPRRIRLWLWSVAVADVARSVRVGGLARGRTDLGRRLRLRVVHCPPLAVLLREGTESPLPRPRLVLSILCIRHGVLLSGRVRRSTARIAAAARARHRVARRALRDACAQRDGAARLPQATTVRGFAADA